MSKDNYSNRLTSLFSELKPLTPEPPAPPTPEPSPEAPPDKPAEVETAAAEAQAQATQEHEQLSAALASIESLQARIAQLETAAIEQSQVIQEHERLKVALVSVGGLRARLAELEAAAQAAESQVIEERVQRDSALASAGDLRTRLAEIEAEATAAQSQAAEERQRLEKVLASFGGLQARVTELETAVVAAQSQAAQEREQREAALDTLSSLYARLKELEAASTTAQSLVSGEREQRESTHATLGNLQIHVAELEAAAAAAQAQVAEEREQRESAQAALRRLQAHVVELGSTSAEAQSQAIEAREQRESAQAALRTLQTQVAEIEAGAAAAQSQVAEERQQRETAEAALANLRTHVSGLEVGATAARSQVAEEREQREAAQAALGKMQSQVAELEAGTATAQSQVAEEREQREAALLSLKSLEERVAELEIVATDARARVAVERERREAAIASLGGLQIRLAELEAAAPQAQPSVIQEQKSLTVLAGQPAGEVSQTGAAFPTHLPPVRFPVGVKITFPYALLALVFAMAAAYLVSRYVLESIEDRFASQLVDSGKLTSEWMVQEESRILETLRLLANTQGLPEAIAAGDAEGLRKLVLPVAVNSQEEAIEVLNLQGESVLSLRQRGGEGSDYEATRGEIVFPEWSFVQNVLLGRADAKGNKYAGAVKAPWGDYFYIAGPIVDDAGRQVGVLLVGKSLLRLVREIRQNTLAHVTLYDSNGNMLVSTLFLEGNPSTLSTDQATQVFNLQESQSLTRPSLKLPSGSYSEILGPWQARQSNLGIVGTALPESFLARPTVVTRIQALVVVTLAFLLVIAVGLYLASLITRPLQQVVRASTEVARGNFNVNVKPVGNDETAVLAHAFNYMVSGLREGSIYRDLLGRTVSPEVREELRQAFATGNLRLEGQNVVATVLMSDIRGFTTLAERADPTMILTWLNEYFHELVPIITAHGGVVDKFEGDALMAFFGILPRPLPPPESAYQACQAAVAILKAVEKFNARRKERSEAPFVTGIGINTGRVIAGGLGSADRMNYTIIGDTVNTAQRLESFTRQFGESGIVISQYTLSALQDRQHEFQLATLGMHTFKGKSEEVLVYRLAPSQNGTVEAK